MAVSDWVPIASVAATAVVALGVPFITARFDVRRIRAQADEARRNELRTTIDNAGNALTEAIFALDEAVAAASKSTDASVAIDALDQRVKALWHPLNAIATRVGSKDELHSAYEDATHAVQRALFIVGSTKDGVTFDTQAQRGVSDVTRLEAVRAQNRFYDAASTLVGIKRPRS